MTFNFLVAPDFPPDRFSGWYMFNTLLQRRSSIGIHLLMPADRSEQEQMLAEKEVDLVYANPFDASALVREHGYRAFARPVDCSDEMVIATAADSPLSGVEALKPGASIALTGNTDVKLIGLRLLEPADLTEADIDWQVADSYQAVARQVLSGQVDAGFFLADAFHSFSRLTLSRMKVLVESQLRDITHVLLSHPRIDQHLPILRETVLGIRGEDDAGAAEVLEALGFRQGFEQMEAEDVEFMIDLMDTLLD